MRPATLAPCLAQLVREVVARYDLPTWPRPGTSDGWIGDRQHARTTSDHNPNAEGDVRAVDLDVRGIDAVALAEHVRALGAAGFPALRGGYVIHNGRIAGTNLPGRWAWQPYRGPNPHRTHVHVSAGDSPADYRRRDPWQLSREDDPVSPSDIEQVAQRVAALLRPELDALRTVQAEQSREIDLMRQSFRVLAEHAGVTVPA